MRGFFCKVHCRLFYAIKIKVSTKTPLLSLSSRTCEANDHHSMATLILVVKRVCLAAAY